jgi:L-rhamnose-H+ transport protein
MLTKDYLLQTGRADLWQNLPILVVLLWGGFTTNLIWCSVLLLKNKTAGQFLGRAGGRLSGSQEALVEANGPTSTRIDSKTMFFNIILAAATGMMWYFQFFFYSMGQTKMGKYDFSSWTLHMASIIIFSTLWGVVYKEWKGTSRRTIVLVTLGLIILVLSTMVVGYGNYLKAMSNI